ncbi:hypothetical protein AMATHDRAFT_158395 [Amanita thiersii Skay4041]|uniref:Tetrapyrrole biosynthesis uroporphyrinogen III synthase domain-containing protein n=1 Tax=Amanita thiersii Skay4041 TaxID=703135 RepID=A0A2A9NCY7_9AGAR|nr:hypothetical protein AMATHDRAFT_158395 [Amanita thiersii Skay4041]
MPNVLLLRAPSQDSSVDRYEVTFASAAGYTPISIPVLETTLTNLPTLGSTLRQGSTENGYTGVIITSARACEAWDAAIQSNLSTAIETQDSGINWSLIRFYVVGKATASSLVAIHGRYSKTHPKLVPSPSNICGAESGNAEQLGRFIIQDILGESDPAATNSTPSPTSRLLYLTGDKNRDTLPSILSSAGISLDPIQVYATRGSSTFAQDLQKVMLNTGEEQYWWWIVYFAPSAAQFVTPILEKYFRLLHANGNMSTRSDDGRCTAKIAAIGPTTSKYLGDVLHLHVDVTASKPTPEDLLAAIRDADARLG